MKKDIGWLELPDGYEFGIVDTDDEIEELVQFTNEVHDPWDGEMLRRLIEKQPGFGPEMNYYIRHLDTGKIVSTINAIPIMWSYSGIRLRNLELGFVGTRDEYQRKGLFNILYNYFNHLLIAGNYDISSIQGIPFFYRKYGYDFILPLGRAIHLQQAAIPEIIDDKKPPFMDIKIRASNEEDIPNLLKLYSQAQSNLLIFTSRDEELWKAQERTQMSEDKHIETLVLMNNGEIDGYLRVGERKEHGKEEVASILIKESSVLSYNSVMRTLHELKEMALRANTSLIEIPGDLTSNLGQIAIDYGGILHRGWKYQIRIPNVTQFLNKIRPVLEARLKDTMYQNLSREILISTYQDCYRFTFKKGKLEPIENLGMQSTRSREGIRIPPHDLVRMILGDYSIEELRYQDMDFIVRPGSKHLLETLFPKQESFLYPYLL